MTQDLINRQEYIKLKVPSRLLYIRSIQALIGQLAQQLGFCHTRIQDIELIVDEICGNAIEHGSETNASGIDLTLTVGASRLEILVQDKGKKKHDNWLMTGRLDEVSRERSPDRERGHGIYITQKLSDHFEIQPNSRGGTDVRIVFDLSPVAPELTQTPSNRGEQS